jgi:hypothetical protein
MVCAEGPSEEGALLAGVFCRQPQALGRPRGVTWLAGVQVNFPVNHCLLALPGVKKEDLKRVLSHPQALAQTEGYLSQLGVIREAAEDTAGSAQVSLFSAHRGVRTCLRPNCACGKPEAARVWQLLVGSRGSTQARRGGAAGTAWSNGGRDDLLQASGCPPAASTRVCLSVTSCFCQALRAAAEDREQWGRS